MGVRESISQYPRLAIGLASTVIVLTLVVVFAERIGGSDSQPLRTRGKVWFSTDDGKTWFPEDERRVPPFDHNGKPAYRAYVYTSDGGKTTFLAFLARFTPEGKARLTKAPSNLELLHVPELMSFRGLEVKKPGEAQWSKASEPRAAQIRQPTCPEGTKGDPVPVYP